MAHFNSISALVAALAIAGGVAPVLADAPAEPSMSVACDGASAHHARRAAKAAQQRGAYLEAAECFRAAGDHLRADRALVRASADAGAEAGQDAAAAVQTAKLQARRIREALR